MLNSMSDCRLAEWLMDAAGPVLRYRTATELLALPEAERGSLEAALLEAPEVRLWLDRLDGVKRMHNSGNDCFENVTGKLVEFGLRAGMEPFDAKMSRFPRILNAEPGPWGGLDRTILAWGLLRAGYSDDAAVRAFVVRRLDSIDRACRRWGFDIYADPAQHRGVPRPFHGKQIVRPDLVEHRWVQLPLIHDLYWMAHLPGSLRDDATEAAVDRIVTYALDPRYQALPRGYGLVCAAKRRYVAVGWSCDLPGYRGYPGDSFSVGCLVQRVELMACFPAARRSKWLCDAVAHLDTFRTETGTWRFPARYLQERATGYYVTGAHMGLAENRRSKRAMEVESTFRMLTIRRLCGAGLKDR